MVEQLITDITDYIALIVGVTYKYEGNRCTVTLNEFFFAQKSVQVENALVKAYLSLSEKEFDNLMTRVQRIIVDSHSKISERGISHINRLKNTPDNSQLSRHIKGMETLLDAQTEYFYYLLDLICKYKTDETNETDEKNLVGLSLKQQIILLDLLGVLNTIGVDDNKKNASILISNLLGKNTQNIRNCLTYYGANSDSNPLKNPENPKAVIKLLTELGYTDLANRATERYKNSLSKVEPR